MNDRLCVLVRGRVQGVGFRYAARAHAASLGLTGWVRNRSDGSVEALFEGPREALEAMRDWCEQGPPLARVDAVACSWSALAGPPIEGMRIRG